jgi:hypothetical protein
MRRDREAVFSVIARSEATKQSILSSASLVWIASRSLSSGARSRDPLARNDGRKTDGFQNLLRWPFEN